MGSMSTEGEILQFSVLPYRCSICPPLVRRQMSNLAVLVDSKTQNASLFPVHAMFRHDCPLTVKLASMQWNLANKKLGDILHLCPFLLCPSWLLCSWVWKFRRDLWITLYVRHVIRKRGTVICKRGTVICKTRIVICKRGTVICKKGIFYMKDRYCHMYDRYCHM